MGGCEKGQGAEDHSSISREESHIYLTGFRYDLPFSTDAQNGQSATG